MTLPEQISDPDSLTRERALELVTGFLSRPLQEAQSDAECNGETSSSGTANGRGSDGVGGGALPLDWAVWQLLDSLFPTGGFAHSLGLEAAFQAGSVLDPASLENFLLCSLQNNAALLLPYVFAGARLPRVECWLELNGLLHATLTTHVARKASVTQGSALLRSASNVFAEIPDLKSMRECVRPPMSSSPHHAPTFGVLCGLLGVGERTAQRSYLFICLRDILSAGTRLNIIGPIESAKMQHRLGGKTEALLERYADRPLREAHQTAPLLELFQAGHDQLFSRMFCS